MTVDVGFYVYHFNMGIPGRGANFYFLIIRGHFFIFVIKREILYFPFKQTMSRSGQTSNSCHLMEYSHNKNKASGRSAIYLSWTVQLLGYILRKRH